MKLCGSATYRSGPTPVRHVGLISSTVDGMLALNLFRLQLIQLRKLCAGAIVNTQELRAS
jgi:hypothetical protein